MTFVNLFTITTTALSIAIHAILIFLILRKDSKSWLNRSLALYLFFMGILQIVGATIILIPDPKLSLLLYRSGPLHFLATPFLFYFFVQNLLKKKIPKWLIWGAVLFWTFCSVLSIFEPGVFIADVAWSETAQFYLLVLNLPLAAIVLCFFLLPFFIASLDLLKGYRHAKSAIERNRLKYLFLGISIIPMGFVAILIPPIRHYPIDMVMMTLSGVLFTYTVVRYKLLDIAVIIRKGLLYSTLTAVVTGAYLLLAFFLRFLLQTPEVPISFPAVVSTALVVALIFQPLQTTTQRLIDRIFFRRRYDPQKLVASLSRLFSETLDLSLLAEGFIKRVCETLQIGKAALFLVDEETNKLYLLKKRKPPLEAKDIVIDPSSPLAQLLSGSDEAQSKYVLKEKNIPLEGLDEFGLELFVPLRSQEKLRGILALGPKLSEELYSFEELNLLETIAHSATLALDNASLFTELHKEKERVEKARATLEVKVRARTKELQELSEGQEEIIEERTKELQEKIETLEKFQKVTVGRELKMAELKEEIKRLKEELKGKS